MDTTTIIVVTACCTLLLAMFVYAFIYDYRRAKRRRYTRNDAAAETNFWLWMLWDQRERDREEREFHRDYDDENTDLY